MVYNGIYLDSIYPNLYLVVAFNHLENYEWMVIECLYGV